MVGMTKFRYVGQFQALSHEGVKAIRLKRTSNLSKRSSCDTVDNSSLVCSYEDCNIFFILLSTYIQVLYLELPSLRTV